MEIIGFEKLSLIDFGVHTACTLFTGGCNFRCPFCHNGEIVLNSHNYRNQSIDEIKEYLIKRKGLLDGVVISGGEPTLQKDLIEFLSEIKSLGYLIKLDTNGTAPNVIKEAVDKKLIDYVAMDVKSGVEGYPRAIGLNSFPSAVAQSVEYLKSNVVDYEFRTTLVNELITESDIASMCKWLEGASVIYLQKFVDREGCISRNLTEVPISVAERYAEMFRANGIKALLRNY